MRIEHSVQKSLLGSWKKNSKKQKNEQIEKTVVVFPCFVKNKGHEGQFFFVHHVAHYWLKLGKNCNLAGEYESVCLKKAKISLF